MSKFYENYWSDKQGHLSDFKIKWPKLKKFISLEKEIVIVDFGCGNGQVIKEMKLMNPGAEFPLNDNSVDFIFSSEVIEHIYDTENAFSEIARILKPDGKLLITTPYHGLIKNLLITVLNFNKHFNPTSPHIRFFSKKSLFNLLNRFGFEILKYGYYGRFYPIPHSIFVLAEKL